MPEFAFDWNDLLTCLDERNVIPIVGRELLTIPMAGREVLLDRYLAERLADELGVTVEFGNGHDLDAVATTYLGQGGDFLKIYTELASIVRRCNFPTPPSLAKLAEITDFTLFVTTTFDSLLCQALNELRPGGLLSEHCLGFSLHERPDDLPPDWETRDGAYVYYLFGKLSTKRGSCAVTEEDFLEFISTLQSQGQGLANLFAAFKTNHLLFLGCGFENWLERFFIRAVRGERLRPSNDMMRVVADREAGCGGNLTVFLQIYRMQVFREGDPVQFVDQLHRRWCERHPQPDREVVPPPKIEGRDVFLSYASENRLAANKLYGALKEAGLDVWFDKTELLAGELWESKIEAGIKRCAVFIPLLSRKAQSDSESFFRKEWEWAIMRSKEIDEETTPFIVPVVLTDDPPDRDNTGIRKEFWAHHCSDFSEGQSLQELVNRVKNLVKSRRKTEGGY